MEKKSEEGSSPSALTPVVKTAPPTQVDGAVPASIKPLPALGTAPHDGSDPTVYSLQLVAPPFSFLDVSKKKYNPKMPPPTYLREDQLVHSQKFEPADFLKGLQQPSDGGLKCVDKEILTKQKGVLVSLLTQAAKCIFQKEGFVRISLPVRIFEPRSTLDKIIDAWRLAPTYLTRAAHQTDPILRMKDIITFAVSGIYCSMTQMKPFNPLLGETLEGGLDDGTLIYCEHTSHHPPISTFMVYGPGSIYEMFGSYQYKMNFSANSLKGVQSGPTTIRFADGGEVVFKMFTVKLTGLVIGSRTTFLTDTMRFVDRKNGIKAVIIFDYGKATGFFSSRKKGTKRDDFEGLLYKVKQHAPKQKKPINKVSELTDVESPICKITGSWLSNLKLGEEEYWNINASKPCAIWYSQAPLPSDWRYREDLLWLRRNDIPKADLWKVELEVQQRHDKSERENAAKALAEKAKKKKK